jgi:hypothetical protein
LKIKINADDIAATVSFDPATVVLHRNKNGELVRRKGKKLHEYLGFKSTESKRRPYRLVRSKAHVASLPLLLDKPWKEYDRLTEREPAIKRVKEALPGYGSHMFVHYYIDTVTIFVS